MISSHFELTLVLLDKLAVSFVSGIHTRTFVDEIIRQIVIQERQRMHIMYIKDWCWVDINMFFISSENVLDCFSGYRYKFGFSLITQFNIDKENSTWIIYTYFKSYVGLLSPDFSWFILFYCCNRQFTNFFFVDSKYCPVGETPENNQDDNNTNCLFCPKGTWILYTYFKYCAWLLILVDGDITAISVWFTDTIPIDTEYCPIGETPDDNGQCQLCPRGSYKDTVGTVFCTWCYIWETTTGEGSTSIDDCYSELFYKLVVDIGYQHLLMLFFKQLMFYIYWNWLVFP